MAVAGVAAIADRFDLVILDAWGVLNLGEVPIPRARAATAALRAAGMPMRIISNDASCDSERAARNHRRRGYDFAASEIIAGLDLLPETLARAALPAPVGLIADPPAPLAAVTAAMLAIDGKRAAVDRVTGFAFLSADGWTEDRQASLQSSLGQRPRPLIVCNPDIASPGPGGLAAEPGYYAHRIAAATGISPEFCGKPFPAIYDRVLAQFPQIRRERVLCVGDTLHTDILGARAAGCRALLIEDGFSAGGAALSLAAECGIWPDFVARGL